MDLNDVFTINPGAVILRGVIAILFGILFMAWPGVTLEMIVLLCGAFAIIDGIIIMIMTIAAKGQRKWAQLLPLGIVGIVLGALILIWPSVSILVVVFLIACWAIIAGFGHLIAIWAVKFLSAGAKWLYAIGGILSIILGLLLFFYPVVTTMIFIWIFGLYAVAFGIVLLVSGLWLHGAAKKSGMNLPPPAGA